MTFIEALFAKYGLLAIFLGAGIEGETAVMIGGAVAHRGLVSPLAAVLAAGLGSFAADQLLFSVGRRYRGHERIIRYSKNAAFQRALALVERHPKGFIFGFRFIYGIRIASPLALGTTRIPAKTFIVLNFFSALLWAACFITLGYVFGTTVKALLGKFHRFEFAVIAIVLAVICVAVVRSIKRRSAV